MELNGKQVAKDEAEKRIFGDERREHELRCKFFGADASTESRQLPFYQNILTKQWYNNLDEPVAAPKRIGEAVSYSASSCSSSEDDQPVDEVKLDDLIKYKLPPNVEKLPLSWTWNITDDGTIYYYHLRERVPQWEPPNSEQRKQNLVDDLPATEKEVDDPDALIDIDAKCLSNMDEEQLSQYIDEKTEERRKLRLERLVSVRMISPLPEDERASCQLEARKYKENKEIIRRRRELYQRHSDVERRHGLAIPDYLLSPDGEATGNLSKLSVNGENKQLGIKEPDALGQLSVEPSTSSQAATLKSKPPSNLPMPHVPFQYQEALDNFANMRRQLLESYKHPVKLASSKPLKFSLIGKDRCDTFHQEITSLVAECLRPYRRESCQLGRITSEDDYKYLINRLTHHITTKELRFCDKTGNLLYFSESVKHKSYEFIKQYMRKKGPVYERPHTELDH